jgi:hypothetical protein
MPAIWGNAGGAAPENRQLRLGSACHKIDFMQIIAAVLGGFLGACLGYVAGLFGGLLIMSWMGVSDFEGKRAVMAGFIFGPAGAVAGLALGIWLALRMVPRSADVSGGQWGIGLLVVVGIAAAIGLGGFWWTNSGPLGQNTAAPRLSFEVRVPVTSGLRPAQVTLDTDKNQMPATLKEDTPQPEGDWLVTSGEVELYHRTSRRLLVIDFGNGRQHIFKLKLGASPSASAEWSEWQMVDTVFSSPTQKQGAPPGANDISEMRLRVAVF